MTKRMKLGKDVYFGFTKEGENGPNVMNPPVVIHDPYYHLRSDKRDSKYVLDLLKKENSYAEKKTKHLKRFQKKIYNDILSHIQEDAATAPYDYKGFTWFSTTEKGKSYDIYWRKKQQSKNNEPEMILDVNKLVNGHKFCDIGSIEEHPTKDWLSYTVDFKGDEKYKPYFLNLKTKKYIFKNETKNFPNIDDIEWGTENDVFYVTVDEAHRPNKVWYYKLNHEFNKNQLQSDSNDSNHKPICIYTESDPLYSVGVSKSDSGRYMFVSSESSETSEVLYIDLNTKRMSMKTVLPRKNGVRYDVAHHGSYFYIITNMDSAKNGKVVKYSIKTKKIYDVKKYDPAVTIEGLQSFKNFLIVEGRQNGFTKLWFVDPSKETEWRPIESEEKYADISLGTNKIYDIDTIQIETESFISKPRVFYYNVYSKKFQLLWEQPVPNYDSNNYVSRRVEVLSRDNKAKIPLYINHRKDLDLAVTNPTILYGYGSYGITIDPEFNVDRIALMDLGIIFCVAQIRGGGEKGRTWYEDEGKYLKKKNSFYDFIDCMDYLNQKGITEPSKLAIEGRSAGGLLMGVVLNMAPKKFAVALCGVPFVDVINTMCDPSIPLTMGERLEWGNPNEKKYFDYMRSYSPYDNVVKQDYPFIVVTAGLWDHRVQYWEPLKWITKLRDLNPDINALLKTNMLAGHFSTTDRYEIIKEHAWEYAVVAEVIGIQY